MKLSSYSVSALSGIITGDTQKSPIRTGRVIEFFFKQFGIHKHKESSMSKWSYVETILYEHNDSSLIEEIITIAVDPRHFQNSDFNVEEAVKQFK